IASAIATLTPVSIRSDNLSGIGSVMGCLGYLLPDRGVIVYILAALKVRRFLNLTIYVSASTTVAYHR
ncbi:MAG: hypothetical protein IM469_08370, partial [Microcystis sp. M176S2]|uniref:hypothetical protein n=1 Tax=Microcystis sp. M176S2 TaxID=2771159 RepID=UPI0025856FB1